jgi:lipopolysaccharide export system protein LptC
MSQEADQIRDKRRAFAAPGGSHDRLVGRLSALLPAMVGVLAAVMVISPLFPRGEVSFLLDRTKVAITEERLKVSQALYRGKDGEGRDFSVSAGNAVQRSIREPVVQMQDLVAQIALSDGPAQISAKNGSYDVRSDIVRVDGALDFRASGGYQMVTRDMSIDMKSRMAVGSGGVSGVIPSGTFSADRVTADLANRILTLDGKARLQMRPGKIRMPK